MWNIPVFQVWHLFHIFKHWACHTTPGFGSQSVLSSPIFPLTPMLQPLLVVPCSYLRAFAHVFSVPLPRKPLTNNCMSSSFFVQRALAICHSSPLFHFVFFPALPWLHFKLSTHPSIHQPMYPFTHPSTYPPTYPSYKCTGTGQTENGYCVVESWMEILEVVQCSGKLEFCLSSGKGYSKPTLKYLKRNFTKIKFISQ